MSGPHKLRIAASVFLAALLSTSGNIQPAKSCTEIILNKSSGMLISGRTLDYNADLGSKLCFREKGKQISDPGLSFTELKCKPLSWNVKHNAVLVDAFDLPAFVDGMNDQGLSVACLWHQDTQPASSTAPGSRALSNVALVEYLVENAATIEEAKSLASKLSLYLSTYQGQPMTLHWIITDKSGKSTVLELENGKAKFFDEVKDVGVMTNQPAYDKQLSKLAGFKEKCKEGACPIPGDYDSSSRFIKSAYLVSHLPDFKTEEDGVAAALQILHNVESPRGAQANGSYTQWFVVRDHKNLKYWLSDVKHPGSKLVDLKTIDFKSLAQLKVPVESEETGDIARFEKSKNHNNELGEKI